MDIGTVLNLVGTARSFLGGGSDDGKQREQKSLLDIYDDVKTRNYDIKLTQEQIAPPGQIQGIQQIDYASTRQFWDNLLKEYMRG
jgi:hypothetical protein|tara:strand:+ start:216 stop:470 length:255 start_codon:yes stop_codon:yes gene_type:complete